jgi:hypothetical protein
LPRKRLAYEPVCAQFDLPDFLKNFARNHESIAAKEATCF